MGTTDSLPRLANLTHPSKSAPKGTSFVRLVQALAQGKNEVRSAWAIAEDKKEWRSTPEVTVALKAAVSASTTFDSDNAEPLVVYQTIASEFVELLRGASVVSKIQGFHRVPFNTRVTRETLANTSVAWVGESRPTPAGEAAFDDLALARAKVGGVCVITRELSRATSQSAEERIKADLIGSIAKFVDERFLDPQYSAVANVSPASITNGLAPVMSSGTSVSNITSDFLALFQKFTTADIPWIAPALVMKPETALALSLKRTSGDMLAFPGISVTGGTVFGVPVIVSSHCPGSMSGGNLIVLLDADSVMLADDGEVGISITEAGAIQLDSSPSGSASALISLWQNGLIGVRAIRAINWLRRHDGGVAYIDGVNY